MKGIVCLLLLVAGATASFPHPVTSLKIVNTYPRNGAQYVHPYTKIGITFSSPLNSILANSITVAGTSGKKYTGSVKLSANRKTLIFSPDEHFALGDTIHYTFAEGEIPAFSMTFSIREQFAIADPNYHSDDPVLDGMLHSEKNSLKYAALSLPNEPFDSLPKIDILTNDDPSDGDVYIANYTWYSVQPYTYGLVLSKDGSVKSVMGNGLDYYNDFKPHPNGTYTYFDARQNVFFVTDTNFTIVDTIAAPDGFITDGHELRQTADGNHIFIGVDQIFMDMSTIVPKGLKQVLIIVPVIFEYDREKNLVFEWRAIDHFKVTDATHEDMFASTIDFCHMNAIEFDTDSNLIVSCRHMDEIAKIDRESGDLLWRWGGNNNQFLIENDTMFFSHQHAIRRTNEGTYIMMDNGNFHTSLAQFSRAIEYRLDQTNKIATRVWEFRHTPDVYSGAMGFVQRLPNKGTLIGWGECDSVSVTEIDSNNITHFEMRMRDENYSYRAFKFDSNYIRSGLITSSVRSTGEPGMYISVIPNPVSDLATIKCEMAKTGNTDLTLYDALGREVSKIYSGYLSQGLSSFAFTSRNIADGVYDLRANMPGTAPIDVKVVITK
jgi:hypothetical protein